MRRAYAAIDIGVVRLGNAWIERRWSTYTGATTELLLHGAGADCLARKSPEYHIDYGTRPLAVTDLGDVCWSEVCDPFGASVILEQSGPGVGVRLQTLLTHQQPWMLRHLEIMNTGSETVELSRVAADILPVDPARFRPAPGDGPATREHNGFLHYGVLRGASCSLLFGATPAHKIGLFAPNPRYCAPVWTGSHLLAPGKTWVAPPVILYRAGGQDPHRLADDLHHLYADWQAYSAECRNQRGYAR